MNEEQIENDENNSELKDYVKQYYMYARDEIKREDEITFQRSMLTLGFQGFLVTSSAIMIGGSQKIDSYPAGKIALLVIIGLAGLLLSWISYYGIRASRNSQYHAKDEWVTFNRANGLVYPKYLPQITKNSDETRQEREAKRSMRGKLDFGSVYAQAIPSIMALFWGAWTTTILVSYFLSLAPIF